MYSNKDFNAAPPYSQESAVGVVMAVGSLGDKLNRDRGEKSSTYLSRDGGVNWAEVAKTPLIYDIGDHGGLIVAASH